MATDSFKTKLIKITARQDLMLAVLLVLIIFMMILPLPTLLVDVLIALNLSLSIILLMVAIYLKTPLGFTTFPAVLLIATLFRLSLSITTTRLILLQADAGAIIDTFGNFVIQGNLIVGLVVFLIITIVQFVVITKGSERIAEVAARFTLDAMPGKQMSIDSDLRSGGIDLEEASRRRTNLEKESQLYGAMDGAMKFVKGDAIAGLVIIAVNIIGGLAIGTTQDGLEMGQALEIYATLTIGDGLVSQIPALFLSVCSGTIVTRVVKEDSKDLGSDIGSQIFAEPRALQIGSVVLTGFAFIPGFPTAVFLTLAVLSGAAGIFKALTAKKVIEEEEQAYFSTGQKIATGSTFNAATTVTIEMAENLRNTLTPTRFNADILRLKESFYQSLGTPFPTFELHFRDHLDDNHFQILIDDVPVTLECDHVINELIVESSNGPLEELGVNHENLNNDTPNPFAYKADSRFKDTLHGANITYYEDEQQILYHINRCLHRHAASFVGIQETKQMMDEMANTQSDLVNETLQAIPVLKVTEILKRLLGEQVPIKHFRLILEAIADWGQKEKDPTLLTEYVRSTLKRQICHKLTRGSNALPAFLVPSDVEDTIRNAIRQTTTGSYLALDPSYLSALVQDVRDKFANVKSMPSPPVILSSMDVRRHIKQILENENLEYSVVSNNELSSEVRIQPLEYINADLVISE